MAVLKPAARDQAVRDAVVLDLGDLARQGEALRARAREQAEATIADARAERQRILAGAAEQGRAEGYARGLADGKAAGLAQGREAALAEWRPRLEAIETAWAGALAGFEAAREDIIEDARLDAVRLALEIATRIVGRVVDEGPSPVGAQVEAVLRQVSRPSGLAIAVHPEDADAARAALPGLAGRIDAARHAGVVADPSLPRGACVARTAGGEIDASVPVQLERIAAALLPGESVRRIEPAQGGLEKGAA